MLSSEERNWFSRLVIITLVTLVCGVIYYVSSDYYAKRYPEGRPEFNFMGRPAQPLETPHQIVLTKNEKTYTGSNCIVFKGFENKMIFVDLYLLDLDPQQPYGKKFSKNNAKKEMVLGEGRYRLVSVNNKHLVIKRLDQE